MPDDESRPPTVNPYAAPRTTAALSERSLSREEAIQQLNRPARLLMWVSVLSVPVGVGTIAFIYVSGNPESLPKGPVEGALFLVVVIALFILKPAAIITSTRRVLNGAVYPWAWIATVMGLIPFGTGCAMLELVFAFWLLHVLLKPNVRGALAKSLDQARL